MEYLRSEMEQMIREDLSGGNRHRRIGDYGRYQVLSSEDISQFIEKNKKGIDDAVRQFIIDNLCDVHLIREYLYEFVDTGMYKYRDLALERELRKYIG